jgi:hypothetical protein
MWQAQAHLDRLGRVGRRFGVKAGINPIARTG